MKSAKQIIYGNAKSDGSLNNDAAARALLQYRNTPLQDCKLSPAQILFHRQLKDTIPCHPSNYQLHPEWLSLAKQREEKYREHNHAIAQEYNRHARELSPLSAGTSVIIQGKNGKWLKQGTIVEELDHRQYQVRLFGSNRVTIRNRKFIKPCSFSKPSSSIISNTALTKVSTTSSQALPPRDSHDDTPETPRPSTPDPLTAHSPPPSPTASRGNRTPLALRNLKTYNRPGLKDTPIVQHSDQNQRQLRDRHVSK